MSLFLLYDAPFLRYSRVHDIERSCKVTCDPVYQDMVYTCLLYRKCPNWAIFPLWGIVYEIQPILICVTLRWPWKVTCDLVCPDIVYISFLYPGCRKSAYCCSTEHRFRETAYFNMHYLEMTLKGHARSHVTYFAPIYSTYASYTQGAQNQLIFGLWRTVSKIQPILWPWKVTQGHRWPSLPRYGIHMHLTPRGPKMSLFLLYGTPFLSCILF